jgi:hypothetical protein
MKKLILISLLCYSLSVFAHTLVIDAKKSGSTPQHMVYPYVKQAGYDASGTFIIRFIDGREISLGKRTQWEIFNPSFVHDYDEIIF